MTIATAHLLQPLRNRIRLARTLRAILSARRDHVGRDLEARNEDLSVAQTHLPASGCSRRHQSNAMTVAGASATRDS